MVYDDDPSDPLHHDFSSTDRPQPDPECPPTPELYDLIARVEKELQGAPLTQVRGDAQRRQRVQELQTHHTITDGMVLYVRRSLNPGA